MRALFALLLAGCVASAAEPPIDWDRAPIRVYAALDMAGAQPPVDLGWALLLKGPERIEVCRRDERGKWTALDSNWGRCLNALVESIHEMMRTVEDARRRWRR